MEARDAKLISDGNKPTLEEVIENIKSIAETGGNQCLCYDRTPSMDVQHKLMTLGYNLTYVKGHEGIERLLIRW